MSATRTGAAPAPTPTTAVGRLRRHRTSLVIGAGVVLAVVVVILLGNDRATYSAAGDPDNPGPNGDQAVARVLDRDGIDLTVVRSADDLDRTTVDASTTVVVTSADQLGLSTADRLLAHTGAGNLIVVDPTYAALQALHLSDYPAPLATGDPVPGSCPTAFGGDFDGLDIEVDGATAFQGPGCFGGARAALVEEDGVTLFGAGQALTNDQVLRSDNAAVALRLLGQGPRLVWYVPSYDDLVADDGVGVRSLLPDWIVPGLAILALATLFLVLWRGRRLGPLATEPLPVVVKAIETTLSRGRLYRRSGDRAHAARALRLAARTRIGERLRVGAGHDERALVREVARHVGRPERDIADLLAHNGPVPGTDDNLIHLADELAELDREVRRS